MNDKVEKFTAATMHAIASITYGVPTGAEYASGTITITDYLQLIAAKATGTFTIVDYTALSGKTVTADGVVYTEGVEWSAVTDNDTTATNLATAIAVGAQDAAAAGAVCTVTAATAGEAGNTIDLASNAGADITLSGALCTGGQDHASFNADGTAKVQGTDFTAATDNNTTATNLATALDLIAGVTATAAGAVVTVKDAARGTAGNSTVFTQDVTGGSTIGGAGTLGGGVNGDTVVVDGTTCTAVIGTAGANEFSTITELEVLVEAIAGINSTEDGTTVSINADAIGTAGNAKTLALGGSNAGTMAISGATFTGGAAQLNSAPFDLQGDEDEYEVIVKVTALTGGSPTVDTTPEGSYDGGDSYAAAETEAEAAITMTQQTAVGQDKQYVKLAAPRNRIKIVLGGTSPVFTGEIRWVGRK